MGEPAPRREEDDRSLRDLMIRYQEGDLPSFDGLYRRTLPAVRGYHRTFVRDPARLADLVQETYLQLHRARATYDPAFPVKPWLLGIARYVRLQDHRARERRTRGDVGADALEEIAVPPEMEQLAARDALARAMAQLRPDWREAVVLHHVQGLSFREIGLVVGVSALGARIRASRGMACLRRLLAEDVHG